MHLYLLLTFVGGEILDLVGETGPVAKLERFFDNPKELRERELCKDAAFAPFPELERLTR